MKKLKYSLIALALMSFNACVSIDEDRYEGVELATRSWGCGATTKSTTIEILWEETDSVSIYSVNKEGKITHVSNVIVSNVSKDGEYATITAEVDINAIHYYGHYPAGSCPLGVGDKYSPVYNAPSLNDAPRLHDLPQIGQAHGNTIHFQAQTSCFRVSELRKEKLPLKVKVYNEEGKLLVYKEITKDDPDLSAHFSRKSLLGISTYYDYCWYIPEGKTYTIKAQVGTLFERQYECKQTGKKGVIYNFDIWGY